MSGHKLQPMGLRTTIYYAISRLASWKRSYYGFATSRPDHPTLEQIINIPFQFLSTLALDCKTAHRALPAQCPPRCAMFE